MNTRSSIAATLCGRLPCETVEEPHVAVASSRNSSRTVVDSRVDPITAGPHGSTWWQVKDSNLRSFRDGFTVPRLQACDQRKCLTCKKFRAYSPQTADVSRGQPDATRALPGPPSCNRIWQGRRFDRARERRLARTA